MSEERGERKCNSMAMAVEGRKRGKNQKEEKVPWQAECVQHISFE